MTLDELAARTGLRKDKVAKVLWHLKALGWVVDGEEMRRLPVYRRVRELPALKRGAVPAATSHIAALNAAFGIRLPTKRLRGRIVRRSE